MNLAPVPGDCLEHIIQAEPLTDSAEQAEMKHRPFSRIFPFPIVKPRELKHFLFQLFSNRCWRIRNGALGPNEMSMPLPTGVELSAVAAVAIVLTLTGMGLTRLATQIIGFDNRPAKRPAPKAATRQNSHRSDQASAITRPVGLAADGWAATLKTLLSSFNVILNKLQLRAFVRRTSVQTRSEPRAAAAALPERLTIDAQWERSTNVVNRALIGNHSMRTAHIAAGEKLDAAHYALEKLMHELEGFISLKPSPAEIAVFSRASNVVNLLKSPAIAARVAA